MAVDAWREAALSAMAEEMFLIGCERTKRPANDYYRAMLMPTYQAEAERVLAAALGTTYQPECETCGGDGDFVGEVREGGPDVWTCDHCNGTGKAPSGSALLAATEAVGWLCRVGWRNPDGGVVIYSDEDRDRHKDLIDYVPVYVTLPALPSVPDEET